MGWPLTEATTSGWWGRLQPAASVRQASPSQRVERRDGEGGAGQDTVGGTSGTRSPSRGAPGEHLSPARGRPGCRLRKLIVFPGSGWLGAGGQTSSLRSCSDAAEMPDYFDGGGVGAGAVEVAGAGAASARSGGVMPSAFSARSMESHTAEVG